MRKHILHWDGGVGLANVYFRYQTETNHNNYNIVFMYFILLNSAQGMCSLYEGAGINRTHTCARSIGPFPVHVVILARVKLDELCWDSFRGNYVSVVPVSMSGRATQ